jgi:hypothetical protein
VPLLARLVRPSPAADAARLKALVARLGSDEFRTREEATGELRRLGEVAAPALREALRRRPSPEVRRRAERLLARVAADDRRTSARALEVLEQAGTPEARRLLEALANGEPEARQTREAKAALRRLGR